MLYNDVKCDKLRIMSYLHYNLGCRLGRDRMVVGFTATCAISAYHR